MSKVYFKSIKEALPVLRPGDILCEVLSNKFAFVRSLYTNGKHSKPELMMLENQTIYGWFGDKQVLERELEKSNVEPQWICYDHSENGKPFHYLTKHWDNRKHKRNCRKTLKLLYGKN